MDANRFTQKSMEALQGAQQLAQSYGNAQVEQVHLLCAFYAVLAAAVGGIIYKKYNHSFLYYV